MELASRVAVFDQGCKSDFQRRVAELVATVSGDPLKSQPLLNLLTEILDNRLHEMANTKRFNVIILPDKKTTTENKE